MQEKKNPPKNEKNLREREITFLCGKTKNQAQNERAIDKFNYSKMVRIRKEKIKENKRIQKK